MSVYMKKAGYSTVQIKKVSTNQVITTQDNVAVESPLRIFVQEAEQTQPPTQFSMTMRTPIEDDLLTIGFLYSESIIQSYDDIANIIEGEDSITIRLYNYSQLDWEEHNRQGIVSSSCGVCGKLDLSNHSVENEDKRKQMKLNQDILYQLSNKLKNSQGLFNMTGGIHAAALFDKEGQLITKHEDVGRHNAMDKLVGFCIKNDIKGDSHILLLSGRASYELLQKASRLGVGNVVSIGAPSSYAIEIAKENNINLVGFLKNDGFNIYN